MCQSCYGDDAIAEPSVATICPIPCSLRAQWTVLRASLASWGRLRHPRRILFGAPRVAGQGGAPVQHSAQAVVVGGSHSRRSNFHHDLVAPEHGQRPGWVVACQLWGAGDRQRLAGSPLQQFIGFLLDSGQGVEAGVLVHRVVFAQDLPQFHGTVAGLGDSFERVLTGHHELDSPPLGCLHVGVSGLRLDCHGRGHGDLGRLRLDGDGCRHGNPGLLLGIGALVVAEYVVGDESESQSRCVHDGRKRSRRSPGGGKSADIQSVSRVCIVFFVKVSPFMDNRRITSGCSEFP